MIDRLWRIVWPVAVFLGVNMAVQTIFSWYYVGKNIIDSKGKISVSSNILQENIVLIMLFTMLTVILIMIVIMKKDEDLRGFKSFKWHYDRIDFSGFIILLPLGICMCLGLTKLVTIFPIDNIIGSYEEVLTSYNKSNLMLRILVLCILVPVAEELVYRGILYKRMKEYYEKTIAAYMAAIFFGVVHLNLVQGLYAFLAAVILIYVYEEYKTILAPIFLHMVVNTMALVSGEFIFFSKINDTFIAKLFFMILELLVVIGLLRFIWIRKKKVNSDILL